MSYSVADALLEKHGPTMRSGDVAELLHCHPSHVRSMCQKGELPCIRVGSRWVILTMKIADLLEGVGADGR